MENESKVVAVAILCFLSIAAASNALSGVNRRALAGEDTGNGKPDDPEKVWDQTCDHMIWIKLLEPTMEVIIIEFVYRLHLPPLPSLLRSKTQLQLSRDIPCRANLANHCQILKVHL